MKTITRREFLKGSAAGIVAVGLSGIGLSGLGLTALADFDNEALTDEANIDNTIIRDTLNVSVNSATTLAPWGTNVNIPGMYDVYEMLYENDSNNNIYPVLADKSKGEYEGYDHETGSSIYTVYIYDYIYDHAGNHVTASDVAWSFMYQYENESTSGWGSLVSVEALDDTTVQFTFTEEITTLGTWENIVARCFIVSEQAWNDSASSLATDMCGTGAYKFDNYVSGSSVTLTRNEDYWQTDDLRRQEQQANVNTIVYKFVDETSQQVIQLQTGELDVVSTLNGSDVYDFAEGGTYADDFNVFSYYSLTSYLQPNCSEDSPMNDINLRLAVFNAIDQDGIILALGDTYMRMDAPALDSKSDYDMVDWGSLDNYNTKSGVDSDLVQSYLDASDYNGESLKLVVTAASSNAAVIICAQLAQYGIIVEQQSLDTSSYNATLEDSTAWDMAIGTMGGDYNVNVWEHAFSFENTGDGDHSTNFVYDTDWDDLLHTCLTVDGHSSENMEAWWKMPTENAYCIALYTSSTNVVVTVDCVYFCEGGKTKVLPGAMCWAAE